MNNIRDICNDNISNNKNIIKIYGTCENKYDKNGGHFMIKLLLRMCKECKSFACSLCIMYNQQKCVNCVEKKKSW